MSEHLIALSVAFAYLGLSLAVGLWPSRHSTSTEGFVAGDRSMGLALQYFITGATVFSAFAFLGGPGWAYSRGVAAFYILGYGALGFAPFWFLGPRAARLGRRYGFVTQADLVSARFHHRGIAMWMALVSLVAFVPYLALQMKGAGYVLQTVSGGLLSQAAGAAITYGVVTIYVLRSGVLGVGWTNMLQGVFMMTLAWGLGLYLPWTLYGGVGPMFERLAVERPELLAAPGLTKAGEAWAWSEYTSAVWVSIFGFCAWPHLFMKAFTAESDRTLRRTVVLYPTFQIFLVPLFLIGFAGVLFTPAPEAADQILPHMLMHLDLSPVLVGLFCAGALAASMSSGDAMAHAAAAIAVRDGLGRGLGWAPAPDHEVLAVRIGIVCMMLAAYPVAIWYKGSLVTLLLTSYGAVVQFMPGLVAALYLRWATAGGVLGGLVAGTLVTTLFVLWPELRPAAVHPGLLGLTVNVGVLVAASWWGTAPADADELLAVANTP